MSANKESCSAESPFLGSDSVSICGPDRLGSLPAKYTEVKLKSAYNIAHQNCPSRPFACLQTTSSVPRRQGGVTDVCCRHNSSYSRVKLTDQCFSHTDVIAQSRLQAARHDKQLFNCQIKAEAGVCAFAGRALPQMPVRSQASSQSNAKFCTALVKSGVQSLKQVCLRLS